MQSFIILGQMVLEILEEMQIRVASFSIFFQRWLQSVLVVPMGTQSYDPNFERARSHARLPLGHQSFSTIAMY